MDFEQLRAFIAVAESGGFSRAAVSISSTQPTLSRQVKNLEQDIGRLLFQRLGKKVILTEFGRDALVHARKILKEAEVLGNLGKSRSGIVTGQIHLGTADSVVLERVPKILKKFLKRYPHVKVSVHTGSSPEILSWVRDGKCDAGLCMLPLYHPGLILRELWVDRLIGIVHPKHSFARRTISLRDFVNERQLVIEPSMMSYQLISAAFRSTGLTLVPDMTFDSFSQIVEFVSVGIGVGISSTLIALSAMKRKRVARVRIKEVDPLSRRLGLAVHEDRVPEEALNAFIHEIDREYA